MNIVCPACDCVLATKTYNTKEGKFELNTLPGVVLVESGGQASRIRCNCGHYLYLIDGRIVDG